MRLQSRIQLTLKVSPNAIFYTSLSSTFSRLSNAFGVTSQTWLPTAYNEYLYIYIMPPKQRVYICTIFFIRLLLTIFMTSHIKALLERQRSQNWILDSPWKQESTRAHMHIYTIYHITVSRRWDLISPGNSFWCRFLSRYILIFVLVFIFLE